MRSKMLGWLMLIKVVFLVYICLIGIGFIWGTIFSISAAVRNDSVLFLLVTLIGVAVHGAILYLIFRVFLSLWQYHSALQLAVISQNDRDIISVNKHLLNFWFYVGICIVVVLAAIVLAFIIWAIIAGSVAGSLPNGL